MLDAIIGNIIGGAISATIGGFIGYYSARRVAAYSAKIQAAIIYRNALDSDFIQNLTGHILVNALQGVVTGSLDGNVRIEGAYARHKRAVREFKYHLDRKERDSLDKAWNEYHGGNEDYPDFFVMYGMPGDKDKEPDRGQQLLKHRLEKLRSIGS